MQLAKETKRCSSACEQYRAGRSYSRWNKPEFQAVFIQQKSHKTKDKDGGLFWTQRGGQEISSICSFFSENIT